MHGKNFLINISPFGFWLSSEDKEYFLPFEKFPFFLNAKLEDLFDVEEIKKGHFYWKKLDIDLNEDIINNPDKYPLIANIRSVNENIKCKR
jgi:hypothetical protein